MVLLGGQLFKETKDPEKWVLYLKEKGFRAAYCPIDEDSDVKN